MICINNKIYDNVDKKVSWGKFSVSSVVDGVRKYRSGESPFVKFIINDSDNVIIGIETTYPKEWFSDLKIGTKIDFNKYISDITFEDSKGWYSIYPPKDEDECKLSKLSNNTFNIKLIIDSNEFERLVIEIDEEITIL